MSNSKHAPQGQLTRSAAWQHLERAFTDRPVVDGEELFEVLRRNAAPVELIELLRARVSPHARFAGPESLRRHLRLLPRDATSGRSRR